MCLRFCYITDNGGINKCLSEIRLKHFLKVSAQDTSISHRFQLDENGKRDEERKEGRKERKDRQVLENGNNQHAGCLTAFAFLLTPPDTFPSLSHHLKVSPSGPFYSEPRIPHGSPSAL